MACADVFAPDEVAVVHVMNRVVRRCFLLGDEERKGVRYRFCVTELFFASVTVGWKLSLD